MNRIVRTYTIWSCTAVAVMFLLPAVIARFASEDAGMALCLLLFYVVNPIFSLAVGIVAGRNIRLLWNLPLVSAVAFVAGTWAFFDSKEPDFLIYASVYLALGISSMLVTFLFHRQKK